MAIDLPPALPPQLSNVETVKQYAGSAAAEMGKVAGFDMQVSGSHYLNADELQRIFATARTPSQAVRMINAGATRKGRMLVTTYYAQRGNTIIVHAVQGTLTNVNGPKAIASSFSGLKGDTTPTRGEFDRARISADVKSGRFNTDYTATFSANQQDPNTFSMQISQVQGSQADPSDLTLGVSNEGNRFAGRYIGEVGLSHSFGSGTRVAGIYQTALSRFDAGDTAEEYKAGGVAISHPFSWGSIDLAHQEINFDGDASVFLANPHDATIRVTTLASEQIIAAAQGYRLVTFEQLEKVNTQIDDPTANAVTADEEYLTAELGAKFYSQFGLAGKPFRWSASLSAKTGLSDNEGTLQSDTTSNGVDEGKRDAEFLMLKASASFKYAFSDSGLYWGGDLFAQQTDVQLPMWEQFSSGSKNELGAYLSGSLVGDTGIYSSTELGWDSAGDGYTMNVAVFLEHMVSNYEDASGTDGDDRSLSDVGVRFSADVGKRFNIAAVVAEGIQDDGYTSDELDKLEADFFFSTKLRF